MVRFVGDREREGFGMGKQLTDEQACVALSVMVVPDPKLARRLMELWRGGDNGTRVLFHAAYYGLGKFKGRGVLG